MVAQKCFITKLILTGANKYLQLLQSLITPLKEGEGFTCTQKTGVAVFLLLIIDVSGFEVGITDVCWF